MFSTNISFKRDQFSFISIQPRKGQYCVFGKSTSNFLNSIIFPVPSEKSKGIALFKSGNLVEFF